MPAPKLKLKFQISYKFRFIKSFYKIFKKEKNYVFDNCIINKEKIDLDLRKELIKIDSMSTYAIGYLINRICKNLSKNQVYLNIGCWKGFSLVAGMINTQCKVIGVDNFSQFTGPKNDFIKHSSVVERLVANEKVEGSTPFARSIKL